MVLKRQLGQGGEGGSEFPNKRRHFTSTLLKGFKYGRTFQETVSCLEPILRKVVQESVEQAIDRVLRPSYNQVERPASRSMQLQFLSYLPETMFTGNRLLSKDRTPIKVALLDSVSREIVKCGPLSSLKVTILVLDGDFGPDDREDWQVQEFDSKVVKTREGRRPLVAGETTVTLNDGVGYIGELSFTDNSKWSRSGKFRLGGKALPGSGDDTSIREAVSNAFRVKDHRGEAYQKHYPPALDDEVWRLDKIAKDGTSHKKLNGSGIVTVRDLLRLCSRDQSRLRAILDVSFKTWETIIGHARKCDLGKEHYMYKTTGGMLFFDSIHKVVGVNFDGVDYLPATALTSFQMRLVEELKHQAYNNLDEWIPVSDPPVAGFPMFLGDVAAESYMNPGLVGLSFQEQDQHGIVPSPYHSEAGQENCCYHLGEATHYPPQASFNPTFRNSFSIDDALTGFSIEGNHSWGSEADYVGSQLSTDDLPMDDPFQVESSTWQGNGLFISPGNHGVGVIASDSGLLIPTAGGPKTKWCKVLAVVKWRILVRRNVAARKCERFYSYV